jgi:energy-converting hydrogenase Eha subunit H
LGLSPAESGVSADPKSSHAPIAVVPTFGDAGSAMNPDLFIAIVFASLVGIVGLASAALLIHELGRERAHARETAEHRIKNSPYRAQEMKR